MPAPAPLADPSLNEWRTREAEARVAFFEQELRNRSEQPAIEPAGEQASPFAANANDDVLLRWRMLYLERRVAHLQASGARAGEPAAEVETAMAAAEETPDPDRWKWRARYLEARVRHLEQRPESAPMSGAAPQAAVVTRSPEPKSPAVPEERPPALPAANRGAPDDFTLIDGVSALQQSTLNSLGIYHFDQIAAWSPANVAWMDRYLRLRGRIEEEEWVEQAAELAEHGVQMARPPGEGARA